MRSRALQPRSLFRIATSSSTPTAGSVLVASSAATSSSIATATGSSRQSSHVPPSRSLSRTRSRTRANSSSSSSSSTSAASAAAHTANSSVRRSSGGGATPTSARASSSQAFPTPTTYRLSHPVIPVRPPPHSQVSVGLQSFFCQGRPLLEHHNILEGGRGSGLSGSGAGAGSGAHPAMVGVAMMIPSDVDVDGGVSSTSSELEEQPGSTSASASEGTLLRNQQLPDGVEAQIKAKAQALLERMTTLRDELAKASPEERQKMLAIASGSAKDLLPTGFKEVQQSLSSLSPGLMTFQLHLPALQSIPTLAFNKMLDSITSTSSSSGGRSSSASNSPLSLYTQISSLQQFESDRQVSIKQALERGEDPELASALGPESDLVVLGEPEGPRKEWGRGVTSYLAKVGRPFSPPAPPGKGEEAARVKGLDDLMSYHVSTTEGELDAEGEFVEMHEGGNGASMADLLAEHLGESSPHANSHSSIRTSTTTAASTSTSGSGDPEDLNLWLGHAIVQERLKAQLPWDRLVAQMNRASVQPQEEVATSAQQAGAGAGVEAVDVSTLRITLPTTAPQKTQGRNVRRSPKIFTHTPVSSSSSLAETVQMSTEGIAESESVDVVQMDSVRRKRKKKMNKMKYKKLRKRQRSERQRLKK